MYSTVLHCAMTKGINDVKRCIKTLGISKSEIIKPENYYIKFSCLFKDDPEIVSFLIDTFGVAKKDFDVMRIILTCADIGYLNILKWLAEKFSIDSDEMNKYQIFYEIFEGTGME